MKKLTGLILCILTSLCLWAGEMDDEYFQLKDRFETRDKGLSGDLKRYLDKYPYTTYYDEVEMMLGVLLTEKKQYKAAIRTFKKVDWKQLGRDDQPAYFFYQGYAMLQSDNTEGAMTCFNTLRTSTNRYTLQGKYYYAYCLYKQGEHKKALNDFLALEKTEEYRNIVPYYIIQIYYSQKNYDEVWQRAEEILTANPKNGNNAEIYRMLGELYYNKADYNNAIDNLTQYTSLTTKQKHTPLRNDIYLLGMANYRQKKYDEAITYLKQVKQAEDTISQNALLHLGHSYVKTNTIESAKLAYTAAMNMRVDDKIREEAMFNYALTTHQNSTALGESVNAFNDFLKEYPHTEHATEVYQLLASVYMSTKNYRAALDAVTAIPKQTAQTAQIKQYLRYQIGVDAFLQGKMQETKKWMTDVITNEKGSSHYKTDAYYYRAEALYRLRQYEDCYNDISLFLSIPNNESGNLNEADYLMGYALFSLKQYSESEVVFRRYTGHTDKQQATYADAMNRIGDCCFNKRAFNDAIAAYKTVVEQNAAGADYATFQLGYAQGLLRHYTEKVNTMEQLVTTYPKSDYADDALYEIARANLQAENQTKAINAYDRLIKDYPNSNYTRKACLERAMVYRDNKQYEQAIAGFKQTIELYAGSEEAYSALDALEQIYVETNSISEYLAYTKQISRMKTTNAQEEDSLTYVTAELQYMLGNYDAAAAGMVTYISRFCTGGRYCTMATYLAADSYYRLGKNDEAIQLYTDLSDIPGNPYMEETYTRLSELLYDKKDYEMARHSFEQLRQHTTTKETITTADIGILRCSYFLKDDQTTIDVATRLLDDDEISDNVRDEALYNRAKVYYRRGDYGMAAVDFTPLSKNVRVVTGAEAAFLLADCYFRLGALDSSETEIMKFAGQKTQHQYWLAKSLILLSDINVKRGDLFQAKQYLLSLQNNYKADDDIQTDIQQRLRMIEQQETPTPDNEPEDEEEDE